MTAPPPQEPVPPPRHATACRACGHIAQHKIAPGSGPHELRLICEACEAFVKWLPKRLYDEL